MRIRFAAVLILSFVSLQTGIAQQTTTTPAATPAAVPAAAPTATQAPIVAAPAVTPAPVAATNPDAQGRYTLHDGDDVPLKFDQDISSKTAAEGDPVAFVLAEDLKVNGVVVAREGAHALGEVSEVSKNGMMGKPGTLSIRLDYLIVGEDKIHLRGTKGKEGKDSTKSAVVLTVLFGPLGLIKHGHNIEMQKGQTLAAYVAEDIALPPAAM